MIRVPITKVPNECVANAILGHAEAGPPTDDLRVLSIQDTAAGTVWAAAYTSLHDIALQEFHGAPGDRDVTAGLDRFRKTLSFEGSVENVPCPSTS